MFYNCMDLGPVVLNYDIYSKEFQKLQPTHGGTISNSKNGQMVYIYSAYDMHAFSNLLSHGGFIYYINVYGTDDVSMCNCMWCGDAYKDRVVILKSNRFVYTYYYVD